MDIQFSINDGCAATELCYTVNSGEEICLDLSGNGGYANGEVYQFLGAQPNGVYQFQFFTGAGAVSPLFTFEVTEECSPVNTICDCDGNTWPDSFTSYLGDGQLNNGVNPVDGYYINFDCMTWGFDCGEGSGSGDPFNVCLGNLPQSNGCEDFTFGCTYILSCNYDSSAQIDDGSCDYSCYGSTDSQACNFDITATLDDDSCDYSCIGCTDEIACNNNETATIDNGSCTYAEPFTNCAGQCINDADGDGVCDELEVPGCTYSQACNYDPDATEENGSCDFTSCAGCTYPLAENFDPNATIDNGTCTGVGNGIESCIGDLNGDGLITVTDVIYLLQIYGNPCD